MSTYEDSYLGQYNVVMCESPKKFAIKTEDQQEKTFSLQKMMRLSYNEENDELASLKKTTIQDSPITVNDHFQEKGDKLVVHHKWNYKRAALADSIDPNKDVVKVLLIDHGYVTEIPRSNCYDPIEVFFETPALATFCHLADFEFDNNSWTTEATTFFSDFVRNRTFEVLVRGPAEPQSDGSTSLPVELILTESIHDGPFSKLKTGKMSLSMLLYKEGFGVYKLTDIYPYDQFLNSKLNETLEASEDEDIDFFQCLQPIDEWPSPVMPNWPILSEFSLKVRHIDKYCQFYATFTHNDPLFADMDDMFDDVYGTPEKPSTSTVPMKESWEKGEDCVVYHRARKSWFRGRVLKILDKGFQVLMVDFGTIIDQAFSEEMRIPYHFGDVPIQCVRLILDDIGPLKGQLEFSPIVVFAIAQKVSLQKVKARKTRQASQFPIPVRMQMKSKDESIDLANFLKTFYNPYVEQKIADLSSSLHRVFDEEAFNIKTVVASKSFRKRFQEASPYLTPQAPEIKEPNWPWVMIQHIADDAFFVHFDHQTQSFLGMQELMRTDCPNQPPANIYPGAPVACFIDSDWYRAYVLEINEDRRGYRSVRVCLVDFGDEREGVLNTMLKSLPEELLSVPQLCFKVHLRGFNEEVKDMLTFYSEENSYFCLDIDAFFDDTTILANDLFVWITDGDEQLWCSLGYLVYEEVFDNGNS